ncbi:MAG TPA: hypothetical protein ENO22_13265 [candidate division Zixibacteria bacterium]|nr:hypothetical protein [candidate division Zixibacteria bacterium]HER00303.1 hypothetical protein [candidate division Zixibacteria bacterium]
MRYKNLFLLVLGAMLLFGGALLIAGDETAKKAGKSWFDMENCAFCKNLIAEPGLLEHSDWENHKIDNGAIMVTTVEDEYLPAMRKVNANMMAVAEKLQKGEQLYLCGMCSAYGELWMSGAKIQTVETNHGYVEIFTSDDPEMVAKIHAFADKNNEEMARLMEMEMEHGHEAEEAD